jgi:hypothetical protein
VLANRAVNRDRCVGWVFFFGDPVMVRVLCLFSVPYGLGLSSSGG